MVVVICDLTKLAFRNEISIYSLQMSPHSSCVNRRTRVLRLLAIIFLCHAVLWIVLALNEQTVEDPTPKQCTSFAPNYQMHEHWRQRFLQIGFTRIHISEQCHFAYLTTLKTASTTTRQMIDKRECGFGVDLWNNRSEHLSCGNHNCTQKDLDKMESEEWLTMIFVRNPIHRFESAYNYGMC